MKRSPYETHAEPALSESEGSTLSSGSDDREFATTLAKGLEILRCFTPVRPVIGNAELADMMKLSRPTVSRYTYTLVRLGYLRSDAASGKYRLAPGVVSLGYPLLAGIGLRQRARKLMNHLADNAGVSVSMGIRDRLSIVYLETSRSAAGWAAMMSDIGLRYPIASTAIGHAYVAACDPDSRAALFNEIKVWAPKTWAAHSARLREAAAEVAANGFCLSYGGQHPDFGAVAAPFGRSDGELVVFNCVAPIQAVSKRRLEREVGPQLVATLERLRSAASS